MKITDEIGVSKGPYLSITNATYIDGYKILISFDDDTSRLVDFGDYLRHARHPDIRKYLDLKNFKKFKVVYGDLEWPNLEIAFPIEELYSGTIVFTPSKNGLFAFTPKEAIESTRSQNRENIHLSALMLRRLKHVAKKENVPFDRLMQLYLDEGMKRRKTKRI